MNKHILFLQGPAGLFFSSLAKRLKQKGHRVRKIHFNWGDMLFWRCGIEADHFHARADKWERWFTRYLEKHNITDLCLYGDCRKLHSQAIEIGQKHGIKIHVFEEGYIRPNMITLEADGVNAKSTILENKRKSRKTIKSYADKNIPKPDRKTGKARRAQGWITFIYYLAIMIGGLFARQHSHRTFPPLAEAFLWFHRFLGHWSRRGNTRKILQTLAQNEHPYFLFALQLSEDYQIRTHSDFTSTAHSIETVITSFALHADKQDILVVKNHPLDSGKVNYARIIRRHARKYGIANRVKYIDGGSLVDLLKNTKGLVCVNSTSGLQAIHRNLPTKILAPAIYDFKELVSPLPLDEFWQNPTSPDNDFYLSFRKFLIDTNQINGSFYTLKGLKILIPHVTKRLATDEL